MVCGQLCKFYLRKLVLRRYCIVLLAVFFICSIVLLRHSLSDVEEGSLAKGGRLRTTPVTSASRRSTKSRVLPTIVRSELSVISEVTTPIPDPQGVEQVQVDVAGKEVKVTFEEGTFPNLFHLPECQFSSRPPNSKTDIKMVDLMDQLPFDNINGGVWKQGFDITYSEQDFQSDPLQVFVVPHSHNDPGWLVTYEEYYNKQTRNIFNNIVKSLSQDKNRKFIYAEISFLHLWWQEQQEPQKQLFKELLSDGQLEIVTGGWVMNDEANTHYYAMLDQLIEGHWWMKEHLPGVKPRSGWAIDPFGHTPTMAYLLKGLGLENMLIQRVHYNIKKKLAKDTNLEFMWRQEWDQDGSTDMLCHMMPFYSYDIPHTCGPDPKVCCQFDFKRLPSLKLKVSCPWRTPPQEITSSNVAERSKLLLDQYKKKAQLFRTNVLLVPLGDDFRYDVASEVDAQYSYYKTIMDHVNSRPSYHTQMHFGTLSDYFDALRKSKGVSGSESVPDFPSLSGDFYTYSDRDDHYWSGYYTTRPFYKRFDRVMETRLRSADILYSMTVAAGVAPPTSIYNKLVVARRNLGLFQHHDGITGTAKDRVVIDYGRKVLDALRAAEEVMGVSARALLSGDEAADVTLNFNELRASHNSLPKLNLLQVDQSRSVMVYNSLAVNRIDLVRLRVNTVLLSVVNGNGEAIPCQINPVWSQDKSVYESGQFELVFPSVLSGVALETYQVVPSKTTHCTLAEIHLAHMPTTMVTHQKKMVDHFGVSFHQTDNKNPQVVSMVTDTLNAEFSGKNGLLQKITVGKVSVSMDTDFVMYGTTTGRDRSGAYLFLPDGHATSVVNNHNYPFRVVTGPLVKEMHCFIHKDIYHTVTMETIPGAASSSLHITNEVDISQEINKEVAMRFKTNIENKNGIFHTDLNGFHMVQRRTQAKLPLQGNFYPLPSLAQLEDDSVRMSLHTGQPLGVASLQQGWLEVMLDRRLMQDDNRGLSQGIKDNMNTRSTFRLLVEPFATNKPNTKDLSYPSPLSHSTSMMLAHPLQVFSLGHTSSAVNKMKTSLQLLQPLPCDMHLVTLRTHHHGNTQEVAAVLHRKGVACHLAPPTYCKLTNGQVNLQQMFGNNVLRIEKTSFSALHTYGTEQRTANIKPMEMETFLLHFK